jgi:hypothetical protein
MPNARLRRFDITIYRHKSAADSTQIPHAFARIDFYRQGATVSSASITIDPNSTAVVDVYDSGKLRRGGTVTAGASGPALSVTEDPSPTQVMLSNDSSTPVRLYAGTRLVLTSDPPNLYNDPFGTSSIGSFITADANGRAVGYEGVRPLVGN